MFAEGVADATTGSRPEARHQDCVPTTVQTIVDVPLVAVQIYNLPAVVSVYRDPTVAVPRPVTLTVGAPAPAVLLSVALLPAAMRCREPGIVLLAFGGMYDMRGSFQERGYVALHD
jgi:hypothetical protein